MVNVKRTETETDGGRTDNTELFTKTADVSSATVTERILRKFDVYVYAPVAAGWSDWRMRIGALILLYFVVQGTVGVMIVGQPQSLEHQVFLTPFHDGWLTFESVHVFGMSLPLLPKLTAPLGTTISGKSVAEQLVHATPPMLKMILSGALLSVAVGTLIGVLSGYKGGVLDEVLMSVTDIALTIPGLALVLVLAAIFQPKDPYIIGIILGIDNWPGLARTIRSQVLSIREESFVEVDRVMDISTWAILRKDFISQLMPYISINFANSSRRIIFESVALYFIGVLPFNTANWGVMMNLAFKKANLTNIDQLHWLVAPMLMIMLMSCGLILFAQGLDRVFNVRLRARHAKRVGGEEDPEPNP